MMDTAFASAKGLGPKRRQALEAAGIDSFQKLINSFPVRYEDRSRVRAIEDIAPGEEALVEVRVSGKPSQARVHGKTITRAVLYDSTGKISAVWFSQPWMFKTLAQADVISLYGRVEQKNGRKTLNTPRVVTERGLIPVYKPIDGVPAKLLKDLMKTALGMPECTAPTLPQSLESACGLMPRPEALSQIHFPSDRAALERALYRMSFEETLYFMVSALRLKRTEEKGEVLRFTARDLDVYERSLGFPLTGAQKRVLRQIAGDLASEKPMARLVQGDVGCGKTAVAFGAIYLAAVSGYQAAMMAPTEILASQHYESARRMLEPLGVRCGLLTGGMGARERRRAVECISSGEWQAVFGTHALISPDIRYRHLALAVTDEQHRFGVKQRTRLGKKGFNPHVLVMSATPIPRTLALILYGDLDVSVIDELPPGRKPVKTRIVPEEKRGAMYDFILENIRRGRQAYFVCPLVEDSESVDAESAESLYGSIMESPLSEASVVLVHGQQKPEEKEKALSAFARGEAQILVSTTVIEVGINVPSATVMVVENAERFGLAQLHQLRGRVGRGSDESWCFLMTEGSSKLKVLTQTNDGFFIAQKDMEMRGFGDIFGTRQSGALSGLSLNIARDVKLLETVHALAKQICEGHTEDDLAVISLSEKWLGAKNDIVFAAN
ncbi:MAG: ATP-dependent DNA helicase RecG [Clostridia bacterium]|nr:ATP-dependent DNA helicase RecG [Clostridia bacterium]